MTTEPNWSSLLGLASVDDMQAQVLTELTDPPGLLTNLNPSTPHMVLTGMLVRLLDAFGADLVVSVARSVFRRYAQGGWLDLHAEAMGTERLEASAAAGTITLTLVGVGPKTIDEGTLVTNVLGSPAFRIAAETTLVDSTPVSVPMVAVEKGASGNVADNTLTVLSPAVAGVEATNPTGWLTTEGRDLETDAELVARLDTRFDQLAISATEATYRSWALDAGAADAAVIVHPRGQGTLDVVIQGKTGLPTAGLIADVQAHIDAKRPLSADPLVRAYTTVDVDMVVELEVHPSEGDVDAVEAAALALLANLTNPSWEGDADRDPDGRLLVPLRLGEDYRPDRIRGALLLLDHVLAVISLPAGVAVPSGSFLDWSSTSVNVTRAAEL